MAWTVGRGLTLISPYPFTGPNGGLMVLSDQSYDRSKGDPRRLMQDCLSVCRTAGFAGLLCDFEQPVRPMLEAFVRECSEEFTARGFRVYVPERYAHCHSRSRILVPTAMTSGSLPSRLRQAASSYGSERVALEMERSARDLLLPNQHGAGAPLSYDSISLMLASRGGASFFSGELGARYFTYKDEAGRTHFVVYDDPGTIRYKIELSLQLGIREGFMLYPDMAGLGLL
jgi:hypothetical protein